MPKKQAKKIKTGNGDLFSPEFREVVSRLKRRDPELEEIIKRQQKKQTGGKQ